MNYTKSESSIYFLNDKNVASSLTDDIELNPIPSLTLLSTVNESLSSGITNSISNLSSSIYSEYYKKTGGEINGDVTITGTLSSNCFKTDKEGKTIINGTTDNHGSLCINLEHGYGDIYINGETVSSKIDNTLAGLKCGTIQASTGKIIWEINETNGIISANTRDLTSSDIPTLPESKIEGLVGKYVLCADFTTNNIVNDANFTRKEKLNIERGKSESLSNVIYLKYDGEELASIDCADFVKDGFLNDVKVVDGNLRFTFNTDAEGKGRTIIDVKLSSMTNIYQAGEGVLIYNGNTLKVDFDKVAKKDDLDTTVSRVDTITGQVDEISGKVDEALANDTRDMKFDGCIRFAENNQTLSDIIANNSEVGTEKLARNNSIYRVELSNFGYTDLSSEVSTFEGVTFTNSDYLLIHDHLGSKKIPLTDLNKSNVFVIKTGVSYRDFTQKEIKITEDIIKRINEISTSFYETNDIASLSTKIYTNGDIAIEKKYISDSVSSWCAYRYNINISAWQALDGNYNANNVYFDYDIIKAGDWGTYKNKNNVDENVKVGNIKHTPNTVETMATKGKSISEVMDMIFKGEELFPKENPSPTYSTSLNSSTREYGSTVSPTFTITINGGSYAYGSNTNTSNNSTTGIKALSCSITYKKANGELQVLKDKWDSQFTDTNTKSKTLTGESFVILSNFNVSSNKLSGYIDWEESPQNTYIPRSNLQRILSSDEEINTYKVKTGSKEWTSSTGSISCAMPIFMYFTSNSSVIPTELSSSMATTITLQNNFDIKGEKYNNVAVLSKADTWYKILGIWPKNFYFQPKSYQNFYVVEPKGIHKTWEGKMSNKVDSINVPKDMDNPLKVTHLNNTITQYNVLVAENASPVSDVAIFITEYKS